MQSQQIGLALSDRQEVATLTSQRLEPLGYPFISPLFSATLRDGYSQDTSFPLGGPNKGQAGSFGSVINEKKTRRIRCPRASKSWSHSASLPSSQLAHKNQKKSMWSLTQHRFLLSQCTPANISNSRRGQSPAASDLSGPFVQEGLAC